MEVDATDADCAGNEPIMQNGKVVGLTTGGAYGFAVEKSLTFAYVDPQKADMDAPFEIEIFAEPKAARIIAQPAYDPDNERLRA